MSLSQEEAQELARREATAPSPGRFPLLGQHLLERRAGRVVDLTRPIFEGMPVAHYHQNTFIAMHQDHAGFREQWGSEAGFAARMMTISEHAGTHADAIFEYDEHGPTLTGMPLAFFWGEAVCLDMRHLRFQDPDPEGLGIAGEDEVRAAEEVLREHGEEIRAGDIVLLCYETDGSLGYPSWDYLTKFPGLAWDGGEYLAKKGVVNIGTDAAGVENSLDPMYQMHMLCKKYGIGNIESLTGLEELVNTRFLFFGLPLNILDGTGSPIRAFAYLPSQERS